MHQLLLNNRGQPLSQSSYLQQKAKEQCKKQIVSSMVEAGNKASSLQQLLCSIGERALEMLRVTVIIIECDLAVDSSDQEVQNTGVLDTRCEH